MKNYLLILLLFATATITHAQYCGNSGASVCTSDGSQITPGFGPDFFTLSPLINGSSAPITLQVKCWDTLVFSGNVLHVISTRFDSISNLPEGLCWATNKNNNTYATLEDGCIRLSGTLCSAPGQYKLGIYVTFNTQELGEIPTNIAAAGTFYFLRVKNAGDSDTPVDTTGEYLPSSNFAAYGGSASCSGATLTVSLGADQSVCSGSNITLNPSVSGGVSPYTYAWSATGDALSCSTCGNPQLTFTQNSSYSVTVTDAQQATATAHITYTVTSAGALPQIAASNTAINCLSSTSTTSVNITNATGPVSINWGDGNTTSGNLVQTHNYTQAGVYIISVFDAAHCANSIFDTVVNNGIVITTTQQVQPNCPGTSTGTIKVAATGGTGPYTYVWNNGVHGDSVINAVAGSYRVTATDAAQCHGTQNFTLASVNDMSYYVYLTRTYPDCSTMGTITPTVFNGQAPYNYLWSNGSTAATATGLAPGSYTVTVTDNLGCTTRGWSNLINNCVNHVIGTAFVDNNNNCIQDGNEEVLTWKSVVVSGPNGAYYGTSDNHGRFDVRVTQNGNYTVSIPNYYYGCNMATVCGNSNISFTNAGDTAYVNAAFNNNVGFDLTVLPSWSSSNPGFNKQYRMYVINDAYNTYTGVVTATLAYDTNLVYLSSLPGGVNNAAAHTVTWTFDSILPGYFYRYVTADFYVPLTVTTTQLLYTSVSVEPTAGDCYSSNNFYTFSEPVTGSHDPNEKDVVPADRIATTDSVLTYTIHFQNNGTDSTHFIIVTDTLSPNLDPGSVRNVAFSHKYSDFSISGAGILTWTFNPLRLVDSITNPEGSKGFVSFSVKKKADLPVGTSIKNTASIYFDYNEAVVTNTVEDTVSTPVYIFEVEGNNAVSVRAYPNPFSQVTHVVVNGLESKFDFELYDVTGKLQQRISSINNNQFELQRGNLPQGVYLYRISASGRQVAYGKLVVQ